MAFKPAERTQLYLKIALTGASGAGKTWSALALAEGIGKKIAVIDTENKSASLYADHFKFDTDSIEPPYTVDKYIAKMKEAIDAGFDVIVADSLSHAWAGEGGILDRKAKMDAGGTNSFANWNKLTPEQTRLVSFILNAKAHIICTMRSKQEYVLEENDKGKQVPRKVGMAPIQRDGVEYEFTVCFDIAATHIATTSKDRTHLFDGFMDKLDKTHGQAMMKWLQTAKPAPVEPAAPTVTPVVQAAPTVNTVAPSSVESDVPMDFKPLTTQSSESGVGCAHCGAQVVPYENLGYRCPNAKDRKDEHTRFYNSKLEEMRKKQPFPVAVSQGA